MDNLQPIQINITTSGGEEAVKTINSVARALKNLQAVQKSVNGIMTNFGNTKIDNRQTLNLKQDNRLQNTYKNTVKLQQINDSYNKTITKTGKETEKTSNNFKNMALSGTKLFGALYSVNKITKYLSQAFDESASWVENLNVMEVAFGDLSDSAYKFTKSVAGHFGLDSNQILEYVSLFQQMASAMGQSTETAYQMSTALTLLGTDVASLYNKDVKVTMEALRSAIAGQVKPVRQFGFDITSYSIDGLIEQMGILEGYTSRMMTQSQKQLARTILLIQQSKNAWGDLGKTINTYSNQQKILEAQFINLKRAIGDLFIGTAEQAGIATKVLYTLNGVMMAITETIRAFIPEASSSGFNDMQNDIEDTTDSIEELENATSGALLSFDKFNTLSSGEGKGNEWITSQLEALLNTEYTKYLEQWNQRMENVQSIAHDIRDSIMSFLGFTKESVTTTDELGNELTTVQFTLGEGLKTIKVLLPLIQTIITLGVGKSIVNLIAKLGSLYKALTVVTIGTKQLNLAMTSGVLVAIFMVINGLKQGDMTMVNFGYAVGIASAALLIFKNRLLIMTTLKKLGLALETLRILLGKVSTTSLTAAASVALFAGAFMLFAYMDQMNDNMKIIVGTLATLTAALFVGAAAWMAYNTAMSWGAAAPIILGGLALGVAGIVSTAKGIKGKIGTFAKGGYPDEGQMFIANEKGPELVGNIGGRTAVANNDMIVQAIENASYRGMAMAMANNGSSNNVNLKINANSNDLSRALARSMALEFKRQGYKI